ncbi:hypothetical protein ACFL6F_03735 [Planctomycetota bacterium]
MKKVILIILMVVYGLGQLYAEEKELPYKDDPKIVEMLKKLKPGHAMLLPKVKILLNGEVYKNAFRGGPYSRDYTNKMAYAPDRQTALYCGGNHGSGRTNDVWEYHLGSNTWNCLQPPIGRDHAKHKNMLMFMPRKWRKNPDHKMNEKEMKQFEAAKAFWNKYVILKDGHFITKQNEAPLLVGHTWDTLVYDPNIGELIQGTGAHCAGNPILHHKFTGMPIEEVKSKLGKNAKGVPYKTMWMFNPVKKQWQQYASNDKLARLRGMGATMCYIPDWKKTIFYVSAQNVSPNAMEMKTYDGVKDRWEVLKPNKGKGVWDLSLKLKIAPKSEQQTAYSSKHKKMVAVLKGDAFAYDIVKNKWSKVCTDTRIFAHDAKTIFAYDSVGDVFLLAGPRQKVKFAIFDLKTGKWEIVTPPGAKMPRAPWSEGKGYYDPVHNVFVLHNSKGLWVYRHKESK